MKIIFILFIITSCSTYPQKMLWKEQKVYEEACNKWHQEKGKLMTERKPGEETLPVQTVINLRCNENPDICLPPKKHKELREIEHYWGTEITPEYCASI